LTSYQHLHRFIVFTACCTFLLIVAGGLVTSTQSGLSVPDWPNTYGHFMFAFPLDQMVGGILFEHSHRMIASVVGFLTLIVALWLWRREDRPWVRFLGLAALGTVIAQGLLGGLTVLFLLPTAISVSHATLAQTFFALMASLALVTSRWWREDRPTPRVEHPLGAAVARLSLLTAIAVYLQLILGALMRHTQSGLAIPDVPLAYGQIIPSFSPEALERYNEVLLRSDIRIAADGAITSAQVAIHFLHRIWALVVTSLVLVTAARILRLPRESARIRRFAPLLLALIAAQISLGLFTVITRKAVDVTTAHVAGGALLLVSTVLLSLHAVRAFGLRREHRSPAFNPGEVSA